MKLLDTDHRSRVKKLKAMLIIASVSVLLSIAMNSFEFGRSLNYLLATRLEFYVREKLGRSPSLDPRIKILGYDDQALTAFNDPEIRIADWTSLVDTIGKLNPRVVLIDKIFGFYSREEDPSIENFKQALARSGNVAAAAFVHSHQIRFRSPLSLERSDFDLGKYTARQLSSADWLPRRNPNIYGPHVRLRDSFRHIGHILYPGEGKVEPFIRVNENTVVPHLSTYAAEALQIDSSGILSGNYRVPVDSSGRILVNFPAPTLMLESTRSLKHFITAARNGADIFSIKDGDVVVILPLLYTGNLDTVDTPVGRIPGGYINVALINSFLSNRWITVVDGSSVISLALVTLACLCGLFLRPLLFWPAFFAAGLTLLAIFVGSFAWLDVSFTWLPAMLGFSVAGFCSYAFNVACWINESRMIKDALKGSIPEAKLKEILAGRGRINLEASERVVTLMFIDIANFSVIAEQTTPKEVFLNLKEILRDVTRTIHKYGGTVDRTMGDGILCFFGYSYDGEVTENQADQAIRCAIEIQRENIRRATEAGRNGRAMLPFRIGINTASVYIGDLGNEDRIDFTVIGNGVNYAQRLEAACDHHLIMLSGTTINFSTVFNPRMPGFRRKFISIKHHDELIEAIELNPFHDEPHVRTEALTTFRKSFNLERKEQRWPVTDVSRIKTSTGFGDGRIVDFSQSGCCLELPTYLSKGVRFDINLASDDPGIAGLLKNSNLGSIKTEVRWGKATGSGFAHGLKFVNLSPDQLNSLFLMLQTIYAREKTVTEIKLESAG